MLHILLLVLQFVLNVSANTNFSICLNGFKDSDFSLKDAVNSTGDPVTNVSEVVGVTYEACIKDCGPGLEAFKFVWHNFSIQFTAWILPLLALISQLPFGANDALSNFETVLLTVGSPMLAGYSLALAVTSNRWMIKRFRRSTLRSSFYAARILRNLQQVSFDIVDEHILPSLIILEENNAWWIRLDEALNYPSPRWTLAAIMSMSYVTLAYAFTWADTLTGDLTSSMFPTRQSQAISSVWMSLLPIVICNLQLSPKSDVDRIRKAVETANKSFFVVTDAGSVKQTTNSRSIIVKTASRDMEDEDPICPTLVCFYARIFSWIEIAGRVTDAFDAVSHHPGNVTQQENRYYTQLEVIARCKPDDDRDHFYDIFRIYMISALLAFLLQWGTAGAAIMGMYLTPTRGLGCHSGSFLLYALLSTIAWVLLIISSVLARSFRTSRKNGKSGNFIGALVIFFRLAGKGVAVINAAWILTIILFQFSNIFDNCYCISSVLGLGSKAYAVLHLTPDDQSLTKTYWTVGMVMASGTALVFIAFINLLLKRPEQHSSAE